MEKFPENQNNNSESEHPKAAEKVSFKNKLKRIFGTSAAIGATALMVGCGKGNDANAINNTPAPTDDNSPKTESNIEDAGITASQDVNTVDFGDGTSVNISDNSSTSEVAVEEKSNGEVDPAKYWEGDTFHLDDYAEALGCDVRGDDCIVIKYGGNHLEACLCPGSLILDINEGFETKASRNYHSRGDAEKDYLVDGSNIVVECCDFTITNNPDRLNNIIKTLQLFSSVDNPYEHIDDLDCWQE